MGSWFMVHDRQHVFSHHVNSTFSEDYQTNVMEFIYKVTSEVIKSKSTYVRDVMCIKIKYSSTN